MRFNDNTVSPIRGAFSIVNPQEIPPLGDSQKKKRENPPQRHRTKPDPIEAELDVDTSLYTPDGHVEGDEHGLRLDISACDFPLFDKTDLIRHRSVPAFPGFGLTFEGVSANF